MNFSVFDGKLWHEDGDLSDISVYPTHHSLNRKMPGNWDTFFFSSCVYPTSCFQKKFATSRQDDKLAIGWIQNWREKKSRGHHFVGKGKKYSYGTFGSSFYRNWNSLNKVTYLGVVWFLGTNV
jgi:hypothetical protein